VFFFQAEDGIRDFHVTGVQTCALPISRLLFLYAQGAANVYYIFGHDSGADSLIEAVGGIDVASEIGWEGTKPMTAEALVAAQPRSEERRVGKACRCRSGTDDAQEA